MIVAGSPPRNLRTLSECNHIVVFFEPSVGGVPEVSHYEYAVGKQAPDTFIHLPLDNTNCLALFTTENTDTTVWMRAVGKDSQWTSDSVHVTGRPFLVASVPPSIEKVEPSLNGLWVTFQPASGGFPANYSYQYALDDSNTFAWTDTPNQQNQVMLRGLSEPRPYRVNMRAVNTAGSSAPSQNTFECTPFVPPLNAPQIVSIKSILQGVRVVFAARGTSSPATPNKLLCFVDDLLCREVDLSDSQTSVDITGCNENRSYKIQIATAFDKTNNERVWSSPVSDAVHIQPYVAPATPPRIVSVESGLNCLYINIQNDENSYPLKPSFYKCVLSKEDGTVLPPTTVYSTEESIVVENLAEQGPYKISVQSGFHEAGNEETAVWVSAPSQFTTLQSVFVVGSAPQVAAMHSGVGSVSFVLKPSANGFPEDNIVYEYAVNEPLHFIPVVFENEHTFTVRNLVDETYTVFLRAVGLYTHQGHVKRVWTSSVERVTCRPYFVGSAPTIVNIASGTNSLTVFFRPSTQGYPEAARYEYAVGSDKECNFREVLVNENDNNTAAETQSFTVNGLTNQTHRIFLRAVGKEDAWTSAADFGDGRPSVVGSAPIIQNVTAGKGSLRIDFLDSVGSYPDAELHCWLRYPTSSGEEEVTTTVKTGTYASPVILANLPCREVSVSLVAVNAGGSSAESNSVAATPLENTDPVFIDKVESISCGLLLYVSGKTSQQHLAVRLNDEEFEPVVVVPNTNKIRIENVQMRGIHTVQLRATDSNGNYAYSNIVQGEPFFPLEPPKLLKVNSEMESVMLFCEGLPVANEYVVSVDGGRTFNKKVIPSNVDTRLGKYNLLVGGLKEDGIYRFCVKTVNEAGVSKTASNVKEGRPFLGGSAPQIIPVKASATTLWFVMKEECRNVYPKTIGYEMSLNGQAFVPVRLVEKNSGFIVPNLQKDTVYNVAVRGRNAKEMFSETAFVQVKTKGG